jgi:hypothetical protein
MVYRVKKTKSRNRKNNTITQSEEYLQSQVIKYIKYQYPGILYCASLGGIRTSYKQAAKAKLTGYIAGMPDLQIMEPTNDYHGLFIELKRNNKCYASPKQKAFIEALNKRNYRAVVCKGFDEAKKEIDKYISCINQH